MHFPTSLLLLVALLGNLENKLDREYEKQAADATKD